MKKEPFLKNLPPSFSNSFDEKNKPYKWQSFCPKSDPIALKPVSKCVSFIKLNAVNIDDFSPEIDSEESLSNETDSMSPKISHEPQIFAESSVSQESKKELGNEQISVQPYLENNQKAKTESKKPKKKLVLDLDETLICSNLLNAESFSKDHSDKVDLNSITFLSNNGQSVELNFYIRPYARTLLRTLSIYYDIIVFFILLARI